MIHGVDGVADHARGIRAVSVNKHANIKLRIKSSFNEKRRSRITAERRLYFIEF
jgi:hypothetical protein